MRCSGPTQHVNQHPNPTSGTYANFCDYLGNMMITDMCWTLAIELMRCSGPTQHVNQHPNPTSGTYPNFCDYLGNMMFTDKW
ncbi:hypothetical protein J6590_054192 [Homalodisca vitripennis]|nr:hypothetical protein J6590_054192 [Homalodisca vitripennis]